MSLLETSFSVSLSFSITCLFGSSLAVAGPADRQAAGQFRGHLGAGLGWTGLGVCPRPLVRRGGGGGGGEPLAGAAFILPTELITKSLQAANQERSLSAKRGSGTGPGLPPRRAFTHTSKPATAASLPSTLKQLSLFLSLLQEGEVRMSVIIGNLQDSCHD